mmetsp:Transcript_30488/g.62897  ORF Transcript_30488/g.62897 Transcript_30488/m.62897 type:complete len:413 (-) Transcript_30488:2121-3359(-)
MGETTAGGGTYSRAKPPTGSKNTSEQHTNWLAFAPLAISIDKPNVPNWLEASHGKDSILVPSSRYELSDSCTRPTSALPDLMISRRSSKSCLSKIFFVSVMIISFVPPPSVVHTPGATCVTRGKDKSIRIASKHLLDPKPGTAMLSETSTVGSSSNGQAGITAVNEAIRRAGLLVTRTIGTDTLYGDAVPICCCSNVKLRASGGKGKKSRSWRRSAVPPKKLATRGSAKRKAGGQLTYSTLNGLLSTDSKPSLENLRRTGKPALAPRTTRSVKTAIPSFVCTAVVPSTVDLPPVACTTDTVTAVSIPFTGRFHASTTTKRGWLSRTRPSILLTAPFAGSTHAAQASVSFTAPLSSYSKISFFPTWPCTVTAMGRNSEDPPAWDPGPTLQVSAVLESHLAASQLVLPTRAWGL